jgi:hypothetical protein
MQQSKSPADVLNEGLMRGKNMAVALGMILFLLTKFFFVKVVWRRAESAGAWVLVKLAVYTSRAWLKAQPHWERLKTRAVETKVKVVRLTLTGLITALTPVENLLVKTTGIAKQRSAMLADRSAMTMAQALSAFFNAIGGAFQSGFSKPGVQNMLHKIFELVDEAKK